jgi:para-aminobenzoate N-oxygenase AurF
MNATPLATHLDPNVSPEARARVATLVNEFLDAKCPLSYTWSYESSRRDLRALYEKAKGEQWDGRTYLDWSIPVNPRAENMPDQQIAIYGTHLWTKLGPKDVEDLRQHFQSWTLSQFLHGEQGALLATAQIVTTVPWADAKFYASSQVMDEARHVEVYERYLREKVQLTYPINEHLRSLLDAILSDPRWDMKYLGMQILVEGLALAAFKFIHQFTREPLVRELTHNVMRDEARHVAFGVLSLRDYYSKELNEAERREREEFTYEACRLMRDRFLGKEVWTNLGFPVAECLDLALHSSSMQEFRRLLFSRIVPNIKRLGLLTPFLREKFHELGILQFEDFPADA